MQTQDTTEEWRAVPLYEGWYEVSSLGRVKRIKPAMGATTPSILSLPPDKNGYLFAHLQRNKGEEKTYAVHRLVAAAFLPRTESPRYQINHIDGRKANNTPSNLEWCTPKENIRHAWRTGLRSGHSGEGNGRAKLTEDDVRYIRSKLGLVSAKHLSAELNVAYITIHAIWSRRSWKHI